MTAGWAEEVFQDRAKELAEVDVDGTTAWVSAEDTDFVSATSRGIRLLPYFDAYTVGSHPRAEVSRTSVGTRPGRGRPATTQCSSSTAGPQGCGIFGMPASGRT